MGRNNLRKLNPAQTLALAAQMKTALGSGETDVYGVSKIQADAIDSTATRLATADVAVVAAKAAYHQAVTTRDQAHVACSSA